MAGVEAAGTPVFRSPSGPWRGISDVETPPGSSPWRGRPRATRRAILARPGPVLLLAGINDPGNAGTLLRSAEAFGAAGVLFGRGGVDPFAPRSCGRRWARSSACRWRP